MFQQFVRWFDGAAMPIWRTVSEWAVEAWTYIAPPLHETEVLLSNPWARAIGLTIIVYLTIRVIASVYSGDKQNSELGPIGIRPHVAQRLNRQTIVLPRALMPMNMDGVSANLKVFYAFTDAKGKRRRAHIYTQHNIRIGVSPTNLGSVASTLYGYEVPDVATEDVCFPPVEIDPAPSSMPATPDRAIEYVKLHKIVENWKEDDNAPLISMHRNEHEVIALKREEFIVSQAEKVASARKGNLITRWLNRGIAQKRPNVVGSYYIKLEFSHDPWFVLTRHPDRELKMTAWLTVLTSMFALVMDAWPKAPAESEHSIAQRRPSIEAPTRAIRPPLSH